MVLAWVFFSSDGMLMTRLTLGVHCLKFQAAWLSFFRVFFSSDGMLMTRLMLGVHCLKFQAAWWSWPGCSSPQLGCWWLGTMLVYAISDSRLLYYLFMRVFFSSNGMLITRLMLGVHCLKFQAAWWSWPGCSSPPLGCWWPSTTRPCGPTRGCLTTATGLWWVP